VKNPVGKYWTAFYVKSRSEKKSAERLSQLGYEMFCPVIEEIRQWSDRKKKVKEPLFKSYVFAFVNEQERLELLKDHSIVSSVMWLKKPAIIRQEEIEAIKLFLGESDSVQIEQYKNYKPGDLVEIHSGLFAGNKAIMLDDKRDKAVVRIVSIQLELSISLHKSVLQKD
jgi:transcription antitermination factor NusG